MKKLKYVYWKDGKFWLGYLRDYPNYWTQGEDLEDLGDHLRDIYEEITLGNLPKDPPDNVPGVRRVGELVV